MKQGVKKFKPDCTLKKSRGKRKKKKKEVVEVVEVVVKGI